MKEQIEVAASVEEATAYGATDESEQDIDEHDRKNDVEPCEPPDDGVLTPGDDRGAPSPLPGESDYPGRD